MKARLAVLLFLTLLAVGVVARAQTRTGYAVPPGWVELAAQEGAHLFAPCDEAPHEVVVLVLLPVQTVGADAALWFDARIREVVGDFKGPPAEKQDSGPYEILSRMIDVQDARGGVTTYLFAVALYGGRGQVVYYAANTPAAFRRYRAVTSLFAETWDFALVRPSPSPVRASSAPHVH